MSDFIEVDPARPNRNPLFWIILVVVVLIGYIFLGTERGNVEYREAVGSAAEQTGEIDRSLLVPPGMRAREFIAELRAKGQPYPLNIVYDKAREYQAEGSLADAHLLYFFSAREGYADSMIKMAEMSDPNLFRAENSLLDHADALQSYKWYQKVAEQGQPGVDSRIQDLQQWAIQASESGNPYARQLLLVVQ